MTLVIPLSIGRWKPILHKLSSQPRGTKRQAIKLILLLCQIFTWLATLTVQAKLQFSRDYYPIFLLRIFEYVNADARLECPNSLLSQLHILAGRLMIQRLRTLSDSRTDSGLETTLADRNFGRFLRNCKTKGYTIHLMQVLAASLREIDITSLILLLR